MPLKEGPGLKSWYDVNWMRKIQPPVHRLVVIMPLCSQQSQLVVETLLIYVTSTDINKLR